mmetsp:Transcript_11551/g.25414  ORF Transcript_11551/g.25414 Transcript_11551/m.25414 type:complete len:889 (-) Transcript_11551:1384-4050(-)
MAAMHYRRHPPTSGGGGTNPFTGRGLPAASPYRTGSDNKTHSSSVSNMAKKALLIVLSFVVFFYMISSPVEDDYRKQRAASLQKKVDEDTISKVVTADREQSNPTVLKLPDLESNSDKRGRSFGEYESYSQKQVDGSSLLGVGVGEDARQSEDRNSGEDSRDNYLYEKKGDTNASKDGGNSERSKGGVSADAFNYRNEDSQDPGAAASGDFAIKKSDARDSEDANIVAVQTTEHSMHKSDKYEKGESNGSQDVGKVGVQTTVHSMHKSDTYNNTGSSRDSGKAEKSIVDDKGDVSQDYEKAVVQTTVHNMHKSDTHNDSDGTALKTMLENSEDSQTDEKDSPYSEADKYKARVESESGSLRGKANRSGVVGRDNAHNVTQTEKTYVVNGSQSDSEEYASVGGGLRGSSDKLKYSADQTHLKTMGADAAGREGSEEYSASEKKYADDAGGSSPTKSKSMESKTNDELLGKEETGRLSMEKAIGGITSDITHRVDVDERYPIQTKEDISHASNHTNTNISHYNNQAPLEIPQKVESETDGVTLEGNNISAMVDGAVLKGNNDSMSDFPQEIDVIEMKQVVGSGVPGLDPEVQPSSGDQRVVIKSDKYGDREPHGDEAGSSDTVAKVDHSNVESVKSAHDGNEKSSVRSNEIDGKEPLAVSDSNKVIDEDISPHQSENHDRVVSSDAGEDANHIGGESEEILYTKDHEYDKKAVVIDGSDTLESSIADGSETELERPSARDRIYLRENAEDLVDVKASDIVASDEVISSKKKRLEVASEDEREFSLSDAVVGVAEADHSTLSNAGPSEENADSSIARLAKESVVEVDSSHIGDNEYTEEGNGPKTEKPSTSGDVGAIVENSNPSDGVDTDGKKSSPKENSNETTSFALKKN